MAELIIDFLVLLVPSGRPLAWLLSILTAALFALLVLWLSLG